MKRACSPKDWNGGAEWANGSAMTLQRLTPRIIDKPWGRTDLPAWLEVGAAGRKVGEVWFEDASGERSPLLVKYLFTSERLSVQVHPNDAAARAAGALCGKDEAWFITAADKDATIGLGLVSDANIDEIRAAALNGSIEQLIDWRRVHRGDAFYSPAGTVHAIGPGLTLVEFQQNCDLTYRLFDYGRPRELHLDDAMAVIDPAAHPVTSTPISISPGRERLVAGPHFSVERWTGPGQLTASPDRPAWLVPLAQAIVAGSYELKPGEAWLARGDLAVDICSSGELLVGTLA